MENEEIKIERITISEKISFKLGKNSIEIIVDNNGNIDWYSAILSTNFDMFEDIQKIMTLSNEEFESCVKLLKRVREFDKNNN